MQSYASRRVEIARGRRAEVVSSGVRSRHDFSPRPPRNAARAVDLLPHHPHRQGGRRHPQQPVVRRHGEVGSSCGSWTVRHSAVPPRRPHRRCWLHPRSSESSLWYDFSFSFLIFGFGVISGPGSTGYSQTFGLYGIMMTCTSIRASGGLVLCGAGLSPYGVIRRHVHRLHLSVAACVAVAEICHC